MQFDVDRSTGSKSYEHGRTPRTTSYKGTYQAKRDQTSANQTTEHKTITPPPPGFQAGPYFPNIPYFLTAALIILIKASKS